MNTALHKLFVNELQDTYDAEHQLIKALPNLAKAAGTNELRQAFESHLKETKEQASRLEKVFAAIDEEPRRKPCQGMAGIIAEGERTLQEQKGSEALDAALIATAQKAEHYEIASYGCLFTWAELMDHRSEAELLKETLDEEKKADQHLTQVAEAANHVCA
jgi:ferritin-like metal-binding protein YciE